MIDENKFLELLEKSDKRSIENKSPKDVYEKYLAQQRTNNNFDIDNFAKEFGLNIDRDAWLDIDISGILNGRDKKIQVNYFEGTLRQNFTIAHEVGHYLLHPYEEEKIDHSYKRSKTYSYTVQQKEEEKEADFFAANLLIPESILREKYKENRNLDLEKLVVTLADMFKVSIIAMIMRLKYLGIINHWAWINA